MIVDDMFWIPKACGLDGCCCKARNVWSDDDSSSGSSCGWFVVILRLRPVGPLKEASNQFCVTVAHWAIASGVKTLTPENAIVMPETVTLVGRLIAAVVDVGCRVEDEFELPGDAIDSLAEPDAREPEVAGIFDELAVTGVGIAPAEGADEDETLPLMDGEVVGEKI